MLRTLFKYFVLGILAILAIKIAFGLVGVAIWLGILAVATICLGAVAYVGIAIFSPSTARRLRERLSGDAPSDMGRLP